MTTMTVYAIYDNFQLMDCQGSVWPIHQFATVVPTSQAAEEFIETHSNPEGEWTVQKMELTVPEDVEDLL